MSFDLRKYLAESRLHEEESFPPRKFKVGDTVEFTPEAFEDYYRKKNMKGIINHRGRMAFSEFIPEKNLQFREV
jgi:hypothetical protein